MLVHVNRCMQGPEAMEVFRHYDDMLNLLGM